MLLGTFRARSRLLGQQPQDAHIGLLVHALAHHELRDALEGSQVEMFLS
jgi:hypothetical protein